MDVHKEEERPCNTRRRLLKDNRLKESEGEFVTTGANMIEKPVVQYVPTFIRDVLRITDTKKILAAMVMHATEGVTESYRELLPGEL